MNPGGGWIGRDNTGLGLMGQYGWGGYQRNGQPVGNIAGMRGDAPSPTTGGFAELARLGLFGPSWAAQNWMADLNGPNAQNPYPNRQQNVGPNGENLGILNGGSLFGENQGSQYHGGGQGMRDFLAGPQTLQGMDALFSGAGRGGGDVGLNFDDQQRY